MFKLNELYAVLEEYAPLALSYKMIEDGGYDNSGILIKSNDKSDKILFTLDLSNKSVEKALELNIDTIVTHHPAIYTPIKNLSVDDCTAPIINAIKSNINVVSMHLNLDITRDGIDDCLVKGLNGNNVKVLSIIDGECGYGKQADVVETPLEEFKARVESNFGSDKILAYGNSKVKKIASFCGGGASEAIKAVEEGLTVADTIVTSDIAHHVLKELIEKGKNVVIIPHYVSEQYGFNKFYLRVKELLNGKAEVYYFLDKRFM